MYTNHRAYWRVTQRARGAPHRIIMFARIQTHHHHNNTKTFNIITFTFACPRVWAAEYRARSLESRTIYTHNATTSFPSPQTIYDVNGSASYIRAYYSIGCRAYILIVLSAKFTIHQPTTDSNESARRRSSAVRRNAHAASYSMYTSILGAVFRIICFFFFVSVWFFRCVSWRSVHFLQRLRAV